MNPASYSAVDSLSFIFDAGLSLQLTNFDEGGHKLMRIMLISNILLLLLGLLNMLE